jgi:hypothetical protein
MTDANGTASTSPDTSAPVVEAPAKPRDPDKGLNLGMVGVLLAAAATSAYFQAKTAVSVGYPWQLCWTLPASTDFAGFVSGRVWINAPRGSGLRRYAAFLTMLAVGLAIGAAESHALLPAGHWLVKSIGIGVPATMVGAIVHLYALWRSPEAAKPAKKVKTPVKAKTAPKAKPAPAKAEQPTQRTTRPTPAAAPSTPRHAAAEQNPEQQGATVTPITAGDWTDHQWRIAVRVARDIRTEQDRDMTTDHLLDGLRAEQAGLKRTTAGHLRRAALAHINSTDDTTTDTASSSDTETATAVGED